MISAGLGPFKSLSTGLRQKLNNSLMSNYNQMDLLNTWAPLYFVKPDATEYIIAIKALNEEIHYIRYKLDGETYKKIVDDKVQGLRVEN